VVQRGWLGVTIGSVNSELAKQHDLSVHEGAYISGFAENSAAREAGVKEGDVVVKIDGLRIPSSTALIETVGRHRPGDKLELTVNRDGKEITYDVILKNRQGDITAVKLEERKGLAALGIQVSSVEPEVLKKLELKNGVRVTDLGKGKITRYTEIRQGFIITKVNDTPVNSEEELNAALEKIKSGQIVTLSGTYEDFPREFLYSFRM